MFRLDQSTAKSAVLHYVESYRSEAVAIARKPSADAYVMGSQNIIETGGPSAVPLTDWAADLYVVADATDGELVEIHGFLPSRR